MKTPEDILKQHAPGIILFGAGDGSVHKWNAVIKAMEEYAIQSVETATANAVHQLEMKQELLDQEGELVRTLEEENLSLRNGYDDLKKENDVLSRALGIAYHEHEVYKAEIDKHMKESATFQARKDTLEEWLTEYRDELTQTNAFHRKDALIKEINELLNWGL